MVILPYPEIPALVTWRTYSYIERRDKPEQTNSFLCCHLEGGLCMKPSRFLLRGHRSPLGRSSQSRPLSWPSGSGPRRLGVSRGPGSLWLPSQRSPQPGRSLQERPVRDCACRVHAPVCVWDTAVALDTGSLGFGEGCCSQEKLGRGRSSFWSRPCPPCPPLSTPVLLQPLLPAQPLCPVHSCSPHGVGTRA